MKLKKLMDEADHEVWFRIVDGGTGEKLDVWSADFHGAHESVMPALAPFLNREIGGDGFYLTVGANPETGRGRVPIVVVPLMERTPRRRRTEGKRCRSQV